MADYLTDGPNHDLSDYAGFLEDERRLAFKETAGKEGAAPNKGSNQGLSRQEQELREANIRYEENRSTLSRVNQALSRIPDLGDTYKKIIGSLIDDFGSSWPSAPEEGTGDASSLPQIEGRPADLRLPPLENPRDETATGGVIPDRPQESVFTQPLDGPENLGLATLRELGNLATDPTNAIAPSAGMFIGAVGARGLQNRLRTTASDVFSRIRRWEAQGLHDNDIISRANQILERDRSAPRGGNGPRPPGEAFGTVVKGPDNQWRIELNDKSAQFHSKASEFLSGHTLDPQVAGNLDEILIHPHLFGAYPDLKDVRVILRNPGIDESMSGFSMLPSGNSPGSIMIVARNVKDAKSVALHEIQHFVQHFEGFPSGSDIHEYWSSQLISSRLERNVPYDTYKHVPSWVAPKMDDALVEAAQDFFNFSYGGREAFTGTTVADLRAYLDKYKNILDRRVIDGVLADEANRMIYSRNAGEVEARMVQDRAMLTGAQRRLERPNPDYRHDEQIMTPQSEYSLVDGPNVYPLGPQRMAAQPKQDIVSRAQELRAQGMSFKKIGDELGYSAPGIKYMLERAGSNRTRGGGVPKKTAMALETEKIVDLWSSGKSTYEIAKQLGVARQTVGNRLKSAGIDPSTWSTDPERIIRRNLQTSETQRKAAEEVTGSSTDQWMIDRQRTLIAAEDQLRSQGRSPKEIAATLNKAYKEGVTAEEISSGTAWWREPSTLTAAGGLTGALASLAFPDVANANYVSPDSRRQEDQETFQQAALMDYNGVSKDDIYIETGWWRNPEGRWRRELIYSAPEIKKDLLPTDIGPGDVARMKLSDFLILPELYEAMPSLREMPLRFVFETDREYHNTTAWYRAGGMTINMNSQGYKMAEAQGEKALARLIYETMVHEVQHRLQDMEGELPSEEAIIKRIVTEREQGLDERSAYVLRPWEYEALEAGWRAGRMSPEEQREFPPMSAQLGDDRLDNRRLSIAGKRLSRPRK